MVTFLMSRGDLASDTAQPQTYPGYAGGEQVTTAEQCRDIFQQCISEGRFPGEHAAFSSATGDSGPLLEVVKECAGMGSFMLHRAGEGYVAVNPQTGYVVGFVSPTSGGYMGVAYIGG